MKRLCITALCVLTIISCTKKDTPISTENVLPKYETLKQVKSKLAEELILLAKDNAAFKNLVEQECLKQVRGDYNVAFDRILEVDEKQHILNAKDRVIISNLVGQMKEFNGGGMPIIFVPVMETRDPQYKTESRASRAAVQNSSNPDNYVIIVDQEGGQLTTNAVADDPETGDDGLPIDGGGGGTPGVPGYIISPDGTLTPYAYITEDMAWETDVWVIGYEEECSPENMVANPYDTDDYPGSFSKVGSTRGGGDKSAARGANIKEFGGKIQITNLGEVESWMRGKVELKYWVFNSAGAQITVRPFGKWRRKHFRNQAWFDFHDLIGYWNPAVWGPVTYEQWIEEKGGQSNATTFTISSVVNGVQVNQTVTIPSHNKDTDLGYKNIQFTDPLWQIPFLDSYRTIYNFNYMNMERTTGN